MCVEREPATALRSASTRFTLFGLELPVELHAECREAVQRGRVTLIEFNMLEALVLSKSEPSSAVDEINSQIKVCAHLCDEAGIPFIEPARDVHSLIWNNCQRVLRGQPLQ